MCKIKNEDFNHIAAALAHEVKNPVALIKANIDILESEFDRQGFNSNIDVIKRQLNKISYIVTDFIQLFRPSSKSEDEEIFIFDLINDIIEEYDISLKGKNIKFEIKAENEDISFNGNYAKLSILFFNILKNSVEAISSEGSISVEIFKKDAFITITVKDTGEGIAEEIKEKITEPFVTTKKEGSGLGLSICKGIVEQYMGSFDIKNRKEGGCEVTVVLKNE